MTIRISIALMLYSPKKQSPPPPTSNAVLPNWDNLNSNKYYNKQTEFVGDIIIKGIDFQYSFIGPEFDSIYPLNDIIMILSSKADKFSFKAA